jgi:hypothetical protein
MSKPKIKADHGGRGPAPKTFGRWVAAVAKRGAKRFRVVLEDGHTKLVAHKNAPDTAKRIEAMSAVSVEAIDDGEAELGAWAFPVEEGELEPEPGYVKTDDDSEDERLLKTFAHLLADAHRYSSKQLVEVVSVQSRNFAEERKNLLMLQQLQERLLAKRLKLPPRLRVSEGEGEDEPEAEEPEDDTFLRDLLMPMAQRMAAKAIADVAGEGAAAVNGAAAKEKTQ